MGARNSVEVIVTNYQPVERDMPETVILISNAAATPRPRHQDAPSPSLLPSSLSDSLPSAHSQFSVLTHVQRAVLDFTH